jgi:hypothetical protein
MSITPQYIYGKDGLPTNVVISFEEWQELRQQVSMDVPEWQVEESRRRVNAYYANPSSAIPIEDFLKELDEEDAGEL